MFADEVVRRARRSRWARGRHHTAEVKEEQRYRIAETFGCPVADSYGCAEVGVVGIECEHGALHQTVER